MRPLAFLAALSLLTVTVLAQEVSMPLERYDALRARAFPSPTPTPAPPVGVTLDQAFLEVQLGEGSARIVQQVDLTLFGDTWQHVPLAATGSFVAADLGGLEGRVTAGDACLLTARGSGRQRVYLESLVALAKDRTATRPTWTLGLALPRAAVVSGALAADARVSEVEFLAGGLGRGRDEKGRWLFVGQPGETLQVRLLGASEERERSALPLRCVASSSTLTTVTRTRVDATAWLGLQVAQGALETLTVALPAELEVVAVDGAGVAGWDVEAGVLRVTPLSPVEHSLDLVIRLMGTARTRLASPLLVPQEAARTSFAAALTIQGDGLLTLAEPGSGRVPDAAERRRLPAALQQAALYPMTVADPARPPLWEVTWPDAAEVLAAQADRLLVDVLAGASGTAAFQAWLELRSSGATSVRLGLPPGFELVAAGRDGTPLQPGIAADGVVLPLTGARPEQVVHISGFIPLALPTADGALTVPVPSLSVPVSRVEVRAVLPGGRSYEVRSLSQRGFTSPPPSAVVRQAVANKIASQAGADAAGERRHAASLFAAPAGAAVVQAAWSALSTTPDPVLVDVKLASEREEWF